MFLAVLGIAGNFVVQMSGGLQSPWQALYLILIGLVAVAYPPRLVASLLAVISALEVANWAIGGYQDGAALLRTLGLPAVTAAGVGFLEWSRRRRSERTEEELLKLNRGLEELEGSEEGVGTSPISEEGKRLG